MAATVDTNGHFGVALNGDTVNGRVAWPGQIIDGCKVEGAVAAPRSINSAGEIALLLAGSTNGGCEEIVLATPN